MALFFSRNPFYTIIWTLLQAAMKSQILYEKSHKQAGFDRRKLGFDLSLKLAKHALMNLHRAGYSGLSLFVCGKLEGYHNNMWN
jgi:23S rRNA G2445 N2-methylase RlmL